MQGPFHRTPFRRGLSIAAQKSAIAKTIGRHIFFLYKKNPCIMRDAGILPYSFGIGPVSVHGSKLLTGFIEVELAEKR